MRYFCVGELLRRSIIGFVLGSMLCVAQVYAQGEPADPANNPPVEKKPASVRRSTAPAQEQLDAEISPTGNVTMDFKDADIQNVLRILSYKSGVNIVAGKDVEGLVTIRLVDVPWEQALDVILRTYGFAYEKEANIIRVTTIENLQQEELVTEVFNLNYAKASEVTEALQEVLTDRGRIKFDERTNLLIVTDLPTNIHKVGTVVQTLDRRTPQVSIEAKIIETTLDDQEKLGINWTTQITARGASIPTSFPLARTSTPQYSPVTEGGIAVPNIDAEDLSFGVLNFSSFQAVLEMLDSRNDTNILSNPRIVTLNNKSADIIVGTIIGIPIFERNTNTGQLEVSGYEERDVGIKLQVTPHVNAQGEIVVDVHPEVSALMTFEELTTELKAPKFSTREATTQVMVHDGETIVVGGLLKETKTKLRKKVPFLGDIPLLGFLFSKKEDTVDKTDLIIFITVRLVPAGETAATTTTAMAEGTVVE